MNERSMVAAILCLALFSSARAGVGADDPSLSPSSRERLERWFASLREPRPGESFGSYVARAAVLQHGAPYEGAIPAPGPETLRVDLERFECVSFIESSLAAARCGFIGEPTSSCFVQEIVRSRYRGGALGDYSSRLHYFVEWIYDNEGRGRVENLTPKLGGEPIRKSFFYITGHAVASHEELARMSRIEAQLSSMPHLVVSRKRAPEVLGELRDGDLVAFVRERTGMLVHHAGFIYRDSGRPRLLHASSYHHRVVLTIEDVGRYLLRRPERRGILVARPLAP